MTDRYLNCLYCDEDVVESKLTSHLYKHFDYYPHQCQNCNFKSTMHHELVKPCMESRHRANRQVNHKYRELLIQRSLEDIYNVAKNGPQSLYADFSDTESGEDFDSTNATTAPSPKRSRSDACQTSESTLSGGMECPRKKNTGSWCRRGLIVRIRESFSVYGGMKGTVLNVADGIATILFNDKMTVDIPCEKLQCAVPNIHDKVRVLAGRYDGYVGKVISTPNFVSRKGQVIATTDVVVRLIKDPSDTNVISEVELLSLESLCRCE